MSKIDELIKLAESHCRNADELHALRTYYGVESVKSCLASLKSDSSMIQDHFQGPYFKLLHFYFYSALLALVYTRELMATGDWKKSDKEATRVATNFDKEVAKIWPELFEEDTKKKAKK
jgi:hypothetical protein